MVKIPELKSQHIWVVILICYLTTAVIPLGAPFTIYDTTREVYDFVESLPEGSIVVMGGGTVFAFDLESSASMIACIRQLERNHLRLVNIPLSVEAVQYQKYVTDAARVDEKYGGTWKYGVNYVQLPYIPGGDPSLILLLTDVRSVVTTDVRGTSFDELPIMDDFKSYKDIALWACPHWGISSIFRYVTGERGVPTAHFAQAAAYVGSYGYRTVFPGLVYVTNGWIGGAGYERLMGFAGVGTSCVDGYSLLAAFFLLFVALGNITMFSKMGKEEEEEVKQ